MLFELTHHACIHHRIQTSSDNFNNGPHLGLPNSLM
jgi:hypothetical protein